MDTHGPYSEVTPQKQWLSDPSFYKDPALVDELNVYFDRMHRLDESLKQYFQKLKAMKNPPTVIMFGDHHPSMSISLPFPSEADRHRVEVVIWNGNSDTIPSPGEKIMPCLTPVIIRAGGITPSPFYQYVEKFCKSRSFHEPLTLTAENVRSLADYEILCYDRLFGKQFTSPLLQNPIKP
jgi:hypothetical protein